MEKKNPTETNQPASGNALEKAWIELPCINTVDDARAFLASIGMEVIGIWHGWILSDHADFELICDTNAELIEHARYERDMVARLQREDSPLADAGGDAP
jgi:hypothetical protein